MSFTDRIDAGRRLAAELGKYRGENPVVLALPRGGVAVAAEVAHALGAPLDLVLVRKIGLPQQPELAMGAVVDGDQPVVVRNEDVLAVTGVTPEQFEAAEARELAEITRRRALYLGGRPLTPVEGRTAIVVDDGIATGATMRAALRAVRARRPARLVLAIPVAPGDTLAALGAEVDDVVCLQDLGPVGAISVHYLDFRQLGDQDVIAALARFAPEKPEPRAAPSPRGRTSTPPA
jgi:predicted phosphoribosyltransferase